MQPDRSRGDRDGGRDRNLISLNLSTNGITEWGKKQLVMGLEHNHHLCRLTMGRFADERLEVLLQRNREYIPNEKRFPDPDGWKIQSVYRTA